MGVLHLSALFLMRYFIWLPARAAVPGAGR
jgi:hypothetical protein